MPYDNCNGETPFFCCFHESSTLSPSLFSARQHITLRWQSAVYDNGRAAVYLITPMEPVLQESNYHDEPSYGMLPDSNTPL